MILSSCGQNPSPTPTESFTITWKNDDGTILREDKVNNGELPRYNGTPTKEGDEQYKDAFYNIKANVVVDMSAVDGVIALHNNIFCIDSTLGADINFKGTIKVKSKLLDNYKNVEFWKNTADCFVGV